jgi:chorismate mutase/prephenate dehydratase
MSKKVITLGPKFSHSYNISARYFSEDEIILAETIPEIFKKVANQIYGIVPMENMLNGSVRETFMSLQKKNIKIFRGFDYKIEHILAGQTNEFKIVASHPQSLLQCSEYIQRLRKKGIKIIEVSSSSKAMEIAQEDKRVAAIGSYEATRYYGLKILKKNISNQKNNITRFIEIGRGKINTQGAMTSLIISPDTDRSGLLFEILAVFKIKELNLTKIESLATGKNMNNYMFYIDIDSSLEHSRLQEAIKFLKTFVKVDILGSYDIIS